MIDSSIFGTYIQAFGTYFIEYLPKSWVYRCDYRTWV